MALYLYSYLNLFGFVGSGTPEDPGTDFGMSVWIEAPNEKAALDWGHLVLADYLRARFRHDDPVAGIASNGIEGWIEEDEYARKEAAGKFPCCRVGEIPTWDAPWRHHNSPPTPGPMEADRTL
ncbi:hypothetical protein TA3x_003360 [Tundrisphaera sp. TA3]|uniref:hypothetical protein n=1 Tax=Tundrisphaera sp. TA3 TaxID=3435775 RepID=UPI003EB6F64F